jgi:cytochrome b6-f complex iron-sulfur subunit
MADETNVPHWQKDFPIERTTSTAVSRRDFARYLCLVSGGLAAGSGLIALKAEFAPPKEVTGEHLVCTKNDVPVGGTHAFVLAGSAIPYVLIHLENDQWRAYEQKCTHLSCAVYYRPGSGQMECPCHNGFFDALTGEPLAGPPPRALPALEVVIKGENIYVKALKHE